MRRPRSEPPEVEIGLDPAWAAEETERPRLETVAAGEAAPVGAVERGPRRRATRSEARGRPRASLALMSAVPHGVLAACAFLPVVMPFPRAGGLPLAAPLVLMAQLGGFLIAGEMGLAAWRRVWLVNLCVCACLWPVTALHAALAREPYVSAERGTLGPVAATALLAGVVVLAIGLVAAAAAVDEPARASVLFVPAALLVPAMLGMRQDYGQGAALTALSEVFLVAGVVVLVAGMVPRGLWAFVAAAGMAGQFVVLWVLGQRPGWDATADGIVPVVSTVLLGWTMVLAVGVPLMAVGMRRVLADADGEEWS